MNVIISAASMYILKMLRLVQEGQDLFVKCKLHAESVLNSIPFKNTKAILIKSIIYRNILGPDF